MAVRDTPITDSQHFLDGCVVARGNGSSDKKQCYVIQCATVPVAGAWRAGDKGDKSVRYVAFITDPQAVQLPGVEQLRALYGLTSAQAKVACEFASGGTYKQVAQRLQVSEETVRAHIKEIYPKTRVNRQADLVRLVLSIGKSGV
jgi:DNA-binding CsgD family transcriptional regulator